MKKGLFLTLVGMFALLSTIDAAARCGSYGGCPSRVERHEEEKPSCSRPVVHREYAEPTKNVEVSYTCPLGFKEEEADRE